MSVGTVLTAEHLMDLLPLTKFMTVRMSRHPDIINIDTDMQTGLILDMGLEGTRPSGVTASGNTILNLVFNSEIRFQFWFAWSAIPKILVRSTASATSWSAWYPLTLGTPITS